MAEEIRRIFSNEAIQGAIDRATAALPKDSKGALVAYGERKADGTYDVAVVARPGANWSVAVGAAMTTDKKISAEAEVIWSW